MFKKYIHLLLLACCFLFLLGILVFTLQQQSQKAQVSQEVREIFKEQLLALPPPPFQKALGFKPSLDEIHLGRMLFNDTVLSRNNDVSCATCHLTNHGFADGNRLNFGALGKGGPDGSSVGHSWAKGVLSTERSCGDDGFGFHCVDPMFRNTLSTINTVYRANKYTNEGLLWDGRFGDLAFQVLLPIHTMEEMCGSNPVPIENNPFKKGGPLFEEPILVRHSHFFDPKTGKQLLRFNSPPQSIEGIPTHRPDGGFSIPARNECLAIAVAKLRKIKWYQKQFQKTYNSPVTDLLIGRALASFISTHVALKTPYDEFLKEKDSLTIEQLEGLAVFFTPAHQDVSINGKNLKGAGCITCHAPPHFGGTSFTSLGIKGDFRSSLSRPNIIFENNTGFFPNAKSSHGPLPNCHVLDDTVIIGSGAPDIGRAISTFKKTDCFQFRVPTLRNVIETYPYFHHGTETARYLNRTNKNFKDISLQALKNAIQFHLNGPFSLWLYDRATGGKGFNDISFQIDPLVPWDNISPAFKAIGKQKDISAYDTKVLAEFVAFGLYDSSSTKKGYFNNDVSHPRKVPSGFFPSITRDQGHQKELPPNGKF